MKDKNLLKEKRFKRFFFKTALILTATVCALGLFAGCETENDGKISLVCTIFPQYDWLRVLTKGDEDISLTVLQTKATDLHNYTPTTSDMRTIYKSDAFVYIGGESDVWAKDVLKSSSAKNVKAVSLLEELGDLALEEEEVPGAEEEDHDHDEEESESDEHIWLSLKNAQALCKVLFRYLCEINPAQSALYQSNLNAYLAELDALDGEFANMVSAAKNDTILFADRFPFRYLCEDYGLRYYAAFSGCSAETEVTTSTLRNLITAVNENNLSYVIVLENSDLKIANSVIKEAEGDQEILEMNSLQSVTSEQIEAGATYLGIMRLNLQTLTTALS